MKVIDLEAHFTTPDFAEFMQRRTGGSGVRNDLLDIGEGRIKNMDAATVDVQVLSLYEPGVQQLDPAEGITWAKKTNDDLAAAIKHYPDRFVGMAAVPPQNPAEAADELERCITKLGFKGVCLTSNARDEYFDNPIFWPLFAKAEKLDVPVYLHPGGPATAIAKGYDGYGRAFTAGAMGWGAEVSLCAARMIYSGLFDKYPGLKIVLGHMGEGLPFTIYRLDFPWRMRPAPSGAPATPRATTTLTSMRPNIQMSAGEYFKRNFYVTNSGVYYLPAFVCTYMVLGADHMAIGTDYPVENSKGAVEWTKSLPISDADKERICHITAETIFKI